MAMTKKSLDDQLVIFSQEFSNFHYKEKRNMEFRAHFFLKADKIYLIKLSGCSENYIFTADQDIIL